MYAEILANASFPDALLELDRELCRQVKARDCPFCGAVLDVADYDRKPRGGPWQLEGSHARRLGLCCRREGCRKRVQPPSVRFLGRRVYLGAVVTRAAVLRQGPTPWRVSKLSSVLGADRRTLMRWRRWWTEQIGKSRIFEIGRADFMRPPQAEALPGSLLDSFVGAAGERMLGALHFLAEHLGHGFQGTRRVTQKSLADRAAQGSYRRRRWPTRARARSAGPAFGTRWWARF